MHLIGVKIFLLVCTIGTADCKEVTSDGQTALLESPEACGAKGAKALGLKVPGGKYVQGFACSLQWEPDDNDDKD